MRDAVQSLTVSQGASGKSFSLPLEGSEPGDVKESVGGKTDVDTNPGALLRTGTGWGLEEFLVSEHTEA